MSQIASVGRQTPSPAALPSHGSAPPNATQPAPLRPDRVERAPASHAGSPHGFGTGIVVGASAEAGLFRGFGATASAGAGVFSDDVQSIHAGSFAGAGAFADATGRTLKTAHSAAAANVIGAFAGAGVGAFVTNAGTAEQLSGIAQTYSVNVGIGPVKLSVQFGSSDGTYVGSVSVGPGLGLDVSRYPTQSVTYSR